MGANIHILQYHPKYQNDMWEVALLSAVCDGGVAVIAIATAKVTADEREQETGERVHSGQQVR